MPIDDRNLAHLSTPMPGGVLRLELSVPGIHCGGCIKTIETALGKLNQVTHARVNLTTKRVTVCFQEGSSLPAIGETLAGLGFDARVSSPADQQHDTTYAMLVRSLGVAAFAAMNIMMLSVGIWAGATDETRQLFHWISAAIALPALAYSGRVFYGSAWNAIRHGRTNMDVPISIGLVITYAMSLYNTATGGEHAYFDAAAALLFFLLIGRTLDHLMREKARTALSGLSEFLPRGAQRIGADNTTSFVATDQIEEGIVLRLAAGERVAVDGMVANGSAQIDVSVVNGESVPLIVTKGDKISSGSLLLSGPLEIEVTAKVENSLLAQMVQLMQAAEEGRGRYRRLADRVSSYYAPIVHFAAFAAFLIWMGFSNDVHHALGIAVSVLIITCPCALALAVPMVQVVAAQRLFGAGVLMRDGSALERLAEIDRAVFDKTGTLTRPEVGLATTQTCDPAFLAIACQMAAQSNHPYSRAFAQIDPDYQQNSFVIDQIKEDPGNGLEALINGHRYRLGHQEWAVCEEGRNPDWNASGPVLTKDGITLATFSFIDILRPESRKVVGDLQSAGLGVEILSGDTPDRAQRIADELGVTSFQGGMLPNEKINHLEDLRHQGHKTLMVGDGVNDAPALAAAHVSMAPSNAADIGRNAADFVLLTNGITNATGAVSIARRARQLTRQNIMLAILYNSIALPFAFLGMVTPLFAAIAMSTSSVIVIANALRQRTPVQPIGGETTR